MRRSHHAGCPEGERLWYPVVSPGQRNEVVTLTKTESLNGQLSRIVSELVRRGVPLEQARREFERQYIVASLLSSDGNLTRSAKGLGVHRNTLRNKVETLGIEAREYTTAGSRRRRARRS